MHNVLCTDMKKLTISRSRIAGKKIKIVVNLLKCRLCARERQVLECGSRNDLFQYNVEDSVAYIRNQFYSSLIFVVFIFTEYKILQ